MTRASRATLSQAEANKKLAYTASYVGRGFTQVGHTMSRWVTLPIIAAGAAAIKFSLDFGDSMNQVQTQAGANANSIRKWSGEIERYTAAGRSVHTNVELAQSLFRVSSEGIRGAAVMKTVRIADKLAMVGRADLGQTTYALIAAQKALHTPTSQLNHLAAQLNATIGVSNIHMDDLIGALGTGVLPVMKAAGLHFRDFTGVLSVATSQGMSATRTMTQFQTGLKNIMAPASGAAKILEKLPGLGGDKFALARTLERKGVLAFLQQLQGAVKDLTPTSRRAVLSDILGGSRGLRIWTVLLGNMDLLKDRTAQAAANTHKYHQETKAAAAEPLNRLRTLWSQIHTHLTDIGNRIMPSFIGAVKFLVTMTSSISRFFTAMPKPLQEAAIAGVVLAAATGPIVVLVGNIFRLFGVIKMLGPLMRTIFGVEVAESTGTADTAIAGLTGEIQVLTQSLREAGAAGTLMGRQIAAGAEVGAAGGAVGARGGAAVAGESSLMRYGKYGGMGLAARLAGPVAIGAYLGNKISHWTGIGMTPGFHAANIPGISHNLQLNEAVRMQYMAGLRGVNSAEYRGNRFYGLGARRAEYLAIAHGENRRAEMIEVHTHVHLNRRQIAEAVSQYKAEKKARDKH